MRFIPGMLKEAEKAIDLWRFGCRDEDRKAVRLFGNAASRRKHIAGYKDCIASKSGHKTLRLQFGALMELVAEFGPVTLRIREEGTDGMWNVAINGFNHHFGCQTEP